MTVSLERHDAQVFEFQDGDAHEVTSTVTSEIDAMPLPISGVTSTILQDINGAIKRIVVTGKLTPATSTRVSGQTVLTISAQKAWLEACQNGLQIPATFTSTFESCEVMVEKFETTEIAGETDSLQFTLNLVVGT